MLNQLTTQILKFTQVLSAQNINRQTVKKNFNDLVWCGEFTASVIKCYTNTHVIKKKSLSNINKVFQKQVKYVTFTSIVA